jgi:deazaflavin-dependent oxidoreductase (nitroreductase family)
MMATTYRLSVWRRALNGLVRVLLRPGLGPGRTYLLTVRGHKSGRLYSTPVTLVEDGDRRWLVALYGEVGWVRNARVAGRITLSRGGRSQGVATSELGPFRALVVWLVVMGAESAHGALRTILIAPLVGDFRARQVSVLTGSLLIVAIVASFIRWLRLVTVGSMLAVGLVWVGLTVCFAIDGTATARRP